MIVEIKASQVVEYCLDYFKLDIDSKEVNSALLISLLRRAAGFLTPCSRIALRNAVKSSLSDLPIEQDGLSDRLDELIENLLIVGDLLELSNVSIDDKRVSGAWVFAAPPSFIVRESGTVFIVGVVPDQESFLSPPLEEKLNTQTLFRQLITDNKQSLVNELREYGFHELPETVWLKSPKKSSPTELIEIYDRKLSLQGDVGEIEQIQILNSSKSNQYYRSRWGAPDGLTGTFIARRPQEFGSPIWCYVSLKRGKLQKLLDLPLRNYRWRPCDAAWHLQMAIDHQNGTPQFYTKSSTNGAVQFDFYSPLPIWAERRLMIIGKKCSSRIGMFGYLIPESEVAQEEKFLNESLWMICKES